ncbi:MAG: tetratricopeptide repeat protein [bacterium]|nr:tetratricopeptide repeat protein [bacterium]
MKSGVETNAIPRALRSCALSVLLLATYSAAAPSGEERTAEPQIDESVLPTNLADLDPAVQRLIQSRFAELRAAPADAGMWGELGLAYEANVLWAQARACFERAAELAPEEMLWRYHHAVATQEAGNFASALELFRDLAAEASAFAPAHQRLGLALLAVGELEQAHEAFSRVIQALPSAPEGYLGAGDSLLMQGRSEKALALFRQAVQLAPRNRGAHHRLGLALRATGRHDEAKRELGRGAGATDRMLPDPLAARVERYAVHLTARIGRAAGLLAAGRPADAKEVLELCLADHPENVTVLNNLAIAHMRLGEQQAAKELLDHALAVNERKFSTWINLTSWAMRTGRPEQALEYATAAVERGESSARTYGNRAQILARSGRFAEALADFEQAAALEARDPRPRLAAADLSLELGRPGRARELYREAIDLVPDLLPAYLGLCRLELTQGRLPEASAALEAARTIAPNHPRIAELDKALAQQRGDG